MVKCDIKPQGVGTSLQRSLWRKMMVPQCMGCLMQSMNLIQMITFKKMSSVIHRMLGEKQIFIIMVVGFTIQIIKILDLIQWIDEKMLSPQICIKND
jgi:hypothetical protein